AAEAGRILGRDCYWGQAATEVVVDAQFLSVVVVVHNPLTLPVPGSPKRGPASAGATLPVPGSPK
ncbi:MAG: hypothetical protein ACR2GB_07880, partial [Nocardioidaceae bacterium]